MIGNSFGILSFNKCTLCKEAQLAEVKLSLREPLAREDYATAQSFLDRKDIKYGKYEF